MRAVASPKPGSAARDEEHAVLELQGYRLTVWAFSAVSMARRTAS